MKNLAVWRIDQSGTPPGGQAPLLTPVERSHLGLEKHLEAWIAADAKLIGGGLTIDGQQVRLDDGRLDLLAIDARDRWVVIELKAGHLDSGTLHQAHPLPEVVLATHPHGRTHPREAVDHHAQQRPVAETDPRPRVDPVEERPRLRRRQDRRRALRHDVLRAPHRRGRVHGQHLVDDEPVAERTDRGQVLLHRRRRPGMRPDVGRHVERRDRPQAEAARPAPPQEPPRRPPVRGPRPVVGDRGREELQESLDGRRPRVDDHLGQHDRGRAGPRDLPPVHHRHQRLAHPDLSPLPTIVSKRS